MERQFHTSSLSAFISLVTSCVGFQTRSHKQPIPWPLHGHLTQPISCISGCKTSTQSINQSLSEYILASDSLIFWMKLKYPKVLGVYENYVHHFKRPSWIVTFILRFVPVIPLSFWASGFENIQRNTPLCGLTLQTKVSFYLLKG